MKPDKESISRRIRAGGGERGGRLYKEKERETHSQAAGVGGQCVRCTKALCWWGSLEGEPEAGNWVYTIH